MAPKQEADLSDLQNAYSEFLSTVYKKQINEVALNYPTKRSLNVDYQELERFNSELSDGLLKHPDDHLKAAGAALKEEMNIEIDEERYEPHVRFFDLPDRGLLIKNISSRDIEELILVKGVITRRAEVGHKVKIALYRCMLCDAEFKIPMTKNAQAPQICEMCKRRSLKLDEDSSYFVDLQRAEMQELLERLKGGEPASHVELWLEDDLVNTVTPGDTLEIAGIVRLRPPMKTRGRPSPQPTYTRYLDVVHVRKSQQDFEEIETTEEEKRMIMEFAKDPRLYQKITNSIASGIYGHTEVKSAIALQLFGGTRDKVAEGLGKIRDDIHLLLIGDPGAAKTRFLQYVISIAPKGVYVSGKSVTGVGLTASAEKDELGDGGWTLKAGALVIASGGIAAVDEFDKIDEEERAALHEVMESQTVSIAKAGIVAQFKSKTAILAAANPKLGRFDPNKLPGEQFDIPPTLLSRFDLIFPIIDIIDEDKDTKMATHMLDMHRQAAELKPGGKKTTEERPDTVPMLFLRKYIAYARRNIRPVLTDDAEAKIKNYYVDLRKKGKGTGAVPITPRQIEGLVRMSESSAKMRLSNVVEGEDAERAINLMDYVLKKTMMDESGLIDIDRVATGIPKSQRDRVNSVLDIIRKLQQGNESVEINAVVQEAKNHNMSEIDARRIIDDFVHKGELYKPQHGFVKLVTRFD